MARIGERIEADARYVARLARGDVAVEVGDDALRQIVGLDRARDRHRLQLGHQAPVPADHALDHAAVGKVIEAALLAVALAGGIDEGEVAGLAHAAFRALQEARLERDRDRLGKSDADEAAGGDGIAGAH